MLWYQSVLSNQNQVPRVNRGFDFQSARVRPLSARTLNFVKLFGACRNGVLVFRKNLFRNDRLVIATMPPIAISARILVIAVIKLVTKHINR